MTDKAFLKKYRPLFRRDDIHEEYRRELYALLRSAKADGMREAANICENAWNDGDYMVNQKAQVQQLAFLILRAAEIEKEGESMILDGTYHCRVCHREHNFSGPMGGGCGGTETNCGENCSGSKIKSLESELSEARERVKELEKADNEFQGNAPDFFTRLRDKNGALESANKTLREALEKIVNVLGPEPIRCGCDGCFEEMSEAIITAKEALAGRA